MLRERKLEGSYYACYIDATTPSRFKELSNANLFDLYGRNDCYIEVPLNDYDLGDDYEDIPDWLERQMRKAIKAGGELLHIYQRKSYKTKEPHV